jgi:sec-independent protein translocase protein TatA
VFRQIGAGEIILIVVVLVLLFGARKLPELARSIGKSARELRKGLREDDDEDEAA